jgi:aminoglycoside phosphotransferase (APT) family kinase protein
MSMHEDQLEISEDTARRLVAEQIPQWRDLPVRAVATAGTVNAICRIGDDLAARFPLLAEDPTAVEADLEAEADAARELAGASTVWHLLDAVRREVLRDALGCSEVQWRRGMAWAFQQSMGLVWYYAESNPSMSRWGRRTLDRLLGDAG